MTTPDAAAQPSATTSRRSAPRWAVAALAVVFALLYAYDLFEALTNLFGVIDLTARQNEFLIDNGLDPVAVPWAVLVANMLVPPLAFLAAWLLGRRRPLGVQALLYLMGLAVTAALSLSFTAFVA